MSRFILGDSRPLRAFWASFLNGVGSLWTLHLGLRAGLRSGVCRFSCLENAWFTAVILPLVLVLWVHGTPQKSAFSFLFASGGSFGAPKVRTMALLDKSCIGSQHLVFHFLRFGERFGTLPEKLNSDFGANMGSRVVC